MKGWIKKSSLHGVHYRRRNVGRAHEYNHKVWCRHEYFNPDFCSEDIYEIEALWSLTGYPCGSGTLLSLKSDSDLTDEQMDTVRKTIEKRGPEAMQVEQYFTYIER